MASKIIIDKNLLKGLEPIGSLSHDKLEELVSKSRLETVQGGRTLFREGEKDNRIIYLISGQVEVHQKGEKKPRLLKAKSTPVKQPLDNHQPHTVSTRTRGTVTILTIDASLFEIITNDTPLDAYEFEVTELAGGDTTDWMLRFLQSRAFLKLPTENIQAILMRMEELPAKKGDLILSQGDQDDYYYIVQSGHCAVTRRPAPKAGEVQLATLKEGDGFGEEALITNGRRNANVRMLEDGVLMRLKKDDFLTYLAEPLITRLSESNTATKLNSGALLIDVRPHDEFNKQHVENSVNIPLSMLRLKVNELNPQREYVLASADGTQSAAAAFLLTQHGFQCGILEGGLQSTSFKLTGTENSAEATIAAPASKRTAAAEKTRQAAEDQARKISQQADNARREAKKLAAQTASAEKAKRDAELEIRRLAKQNQEAEQAVRQQAEDARRKAEEELRKIQSAKQANEEKQKALDGSLKRAQQIAAEAKEAAKRSRLQAEKEAEEIRRKAREEAEQLKQEMETTRRRLEQQASQVEEQKEAERQAAINQARQEAEAIRLQAQREAEQLRAELESAKQAVHQRAAQVEQQEQQKQVAMLEEARSRAMELAEKTTRIAEQEAEDIRRKALEEAEQLRKEMEQTRQRVMEHAERARQEAERQADARAQQQAEEQAHREAEARARQQAEEQARREAEARARQQAEEQARREASQQEQQREARRQQAIRNAKMRREENARRMAEEIKAKLERAEQQRQEEEVRQRGEGLSMGHAIIKRKDGRIILEGEEDIFIFKEPSVSPEQVEASLPHEADDSSHKPGRDELPSFEIEEHDKPVFKPINTQAVHARLAERQASQKQARKKLHVFALAASLLLVLGGGGVYLFLHPELLNEHLMARSEPPRGNTAKASVAPLNSGKDKEDNRSRQTHENNLENSIRERFDNLLERWEKLLSS